MSETKDKAPKPFSKGNFTRDADGLLTHVDYIFQEDGFIDWRKMIPPEELYPNRQKLEKAGKPVPATSAGLPDEDLCIKLGGIKKIAQLRGFKEVKYDIVSASENYVCAKCRIIWVSNYESEGREVTFEDGADAHPYNTSNFGVQYLTTIAINRAFVRAVRNFLKVNIVGFDELGAKQEVNNQEAKSTEIDTYSYLQEALAARGKTYEDLRKRMVKDGLEDYPTLKDIPKGLVFELLEKVKSGAKSLK